MLRLIKIIIFIKTFENFKLKEENKSFMSELLEKIIN